MDYRLIRRPGGFTLVEVLVVVAIIGILAAIAYPSYLNSVRKSNRASARALMMEVAQRQATYYSENASYTTTLTALGFPTGTLSSKSGGHTVTVAANPNIATGYTINAASVRADPGCTPLTLNHLGVAGPVNC